MADQNHDTKRHHYVPETYLNHFRNEQGGIYVYRKDDPTEPKLLTPHNVGVRGYYYSQYRLDGARDHNSVEQLFQELAEGKWNAVIAKITSKQELSEGDLQTAAWFAALQHARVPATREAHESQRADWVKIQIRKLAAEGKLPPAPESAPDILDQLEVTIDPHTSLENMHVSMGEVEKVLNRVTIRIVHNTSPIDFITSDNPVIWFDSSDPIDEMRPYTTRANGPVVFLFPLSPRVILYGDSSRQEYGWNHVELSDSATIELFNRMICRFGYEYVFSRLRQQDEMIRSNSEASPVVTTASTRGPWGMDDSMVTSWVFGKRRKRPKWVED